MNDDRPFSPPVRLALARSEQCHEQARGIVKNHVIGAMSIALLPVPIIDVIALTNVQWNLICKLADHYGVPLKGLYRPLITSVVGGSLPVLAAGAGAGLLKLIPGFGQLAGSSALAGLASAMTTAMGKIFIDHFESGGTLDDYYPNAFRRQFRRQFRIELARSRKGLRQRETGQQTRAGHSAG